MQQEREMAKTKMTKDIVPGDFTMGLALVDALPVIMFGASMIAAGLLIKSPLFIIGALLCLFAGAAKVIWKIIVVLRHKNVWWLFIQMRCVMPVGMLLMLIALVIAACAADMAIVKAAVFGMPQIIFFALGIFGMVLMGVFAAKLDSSKLKSNWIEQLTNAAAQVCFLIAILIIYIG